MLSVAAPKCRALSGRVPSAKASVRARGSVSARVRTCPEMHTRRVPQPYIFHLTSFRQSRAPAGNSRCWQRPGGLPKLLQGQLPEVLHCYVLLDNTDQSLADNL